MKDYMSSYRVEKKRAIDCVVADLFVIVQLDAATLV